MFRVFSKFNALFVSPSIRGAIQEYQTRLIDNVKVDISSLQDRFRQQYSNSEAYEMSKLRDMPVIAGTIGWIKQIESQLDMYMKRVEDVLGKGWQMYAEGQKLYMESSMFRKKLDTSVVYQEWLNSVLKRNLSITGNIFAVIQSRNRDIASSYELQVNFDPQVITLFKEVRNLQWMNYQVPHSVSTVAKDAKRVYPFAVSLIDSLRTFWSIKNSIVMTYAELEPLLYGSENTIYHLLAKGLLFKWESFIHVYDFEAINDITETKHVKLIHDIEESVNILQSKSDILLLLYNDIQEALQQLATCSFDFNRFSYFIEIIQQSVDKLNLELYTNVPDFVKLLNNKIKSILVHRCTDIIETWTVIFQNQSQGLDQHPSINLKVITHELTLRNQVVSLNPPIESTRVLWLSNLQDLISSIINLKKVEANRFDVKLNNRQDGLSFNDIPLAISNSLLPAYKLIDDYIQDAEQYLNKWYQFQDLWDLEASQVFDILGDDMEKWLQILSEIRKARNTFDTNDISKNIGLLKIDFRPVQGRINSKYDAWQREIIYQFAKRLNDKMKEVCNEIETAKRNLERQSIDTSSTEIVVSCITNIQHSTKNLDRWEKEVDIFGRAEATLTRYRFQFPSSWLYITHINNEWNALNEILTRRTKILDEQGDAVRAKVQSEMLRLKERVNTLEEQWQADKPVSGSLNPKDCLRLLSKYKAETTSVQNITDLLVKASSALDIEFEIPPGLEATTEEIRDFGSVWSALDTVWNALNDLKEMIWGSVVPRKVRQRLDELQQVTKNMPTRIRQYSAFQHIQNVLKNLSKASTLLSDLRSEAIHERHWESLYKQLLPTGTRIYYSNMTLGNVWDMNLIANSSFIKDIVEIAQGEMALETFLRQVRDTWSNYTLELINYQNTCRLIKNWDDIFEKSSDHINSLSAMHHSPYFKVFEEEARGWEEKLNRIHLLFDIWIDVQRQWVYLEGVFNNNAEIKHILPVESSRFQNINSELFVILRKVYKSPLILDVLNIPGIQTSIERLNDLLGKVQKALGEYFEKERQRFSRFYFIGDEDLLEIIGNSNDIHRTEKHLSKMFSGISGLVYDEDTSLIKGVISKEGEKVLFETGISLIRLPKVVDWLTEVELQTKITLARHLQQAVGELNQICPDGVEEKTIDEEKFLAWIQSFPTQINLLASQVLWSSRIESCLSVNAGVGLEHIRNTCQMLLTSLANRVLYDLPTIDRKCCESMISELVHQRDILTILINENITDIEDFTWQSQMTHHLDITKDPLKSLSVKQAKATFIYGFEYLGIPEKLVATPLLDRCFLSMTQALDQRLGGSPFGPAGTGKWRSSC